MGQTYSNIKDRCTHRKKKATVDYASPSSWHANYALEGSSNLMANWTPSAVLTWSDAESRWTPTEALKPVADQASASVDVFFVHQTTAFTGMGNAELDEGGEVAMYTLKSMASVFNGSCRVYAPKYRQARLISYTKGLAFGAFDAALDDVKKAFKYYLKHHNEGRPFILAGHSQGSQHTANLIRYIESHVEEFSPSLLREQLVCAYIPGFRIGEDTFSSLPVSTGPADTACWVGWRSVAAGATSSITGAAKPGAGLAAVAILTENLPATTHPVTWQTSTFADPPTSEVAREADETKADVKNGNKAPSADSDVPVSTLDQAAEKENEKEQQANGEPKEGSTDTSSWKEKVTEHVKALWTSDDEKSPEELAAEGVWSEAGGHRGAAHIGSNVVYTGSLSCRINNTTTLLEVKHGLFPEAADFNLKRKWGIAHLGDDFHQDDFALFWMDIRENVRMRCAAWADHHPQKVQ